jgi:hypothetical protein
MRPHLKRLALIGGILAASSYLLAQNLLRVPHQLSSERAPKASEFNENFTFLAEEISRLKTQLASVQTSPSATPLPVGTIIASVLPPIEFLRLYQDQWTLANGDDVSIQTKFAQLTGRTKLPDLRGVFLRGINKGRSDDYRDPAGERDPGSLQPDGFKQHHHHGGYPAHLASRYGIETGAASPPGTRYDFSDSDGPVGWTQAAKTNSVGDAETRPKNVAVFYYIKIN